MVSEMGVDLMGAYEFNKSTYKPITARLNRVKDSDIIQYLQGVKSVNQYIIDLIREDMSRRVSNPLYEVIEDMGFRKDVLKGFQTFEDAVSFLYMYVSQFEPMGRVYVVQRFTGIQTDGHKVRCGKVLNIEANTNNESEEKENA